MTSILDKKLQGFQLIAQEKLQAILCSIPGKKDLIIEQNIIKPLEHICAASWLKLKGIERIFKLDTQNAIIRSPDQVQLYMIRSKLCSFIRVLHQIKLICKSQTLSYPEDSHLKYFHIICIPTCFTYFSQILETEGLFGIVGLHRYNWDFIHLDDGVLSLETPNVFASAFMRDDYSLLPSIAHSLRVLQILYGCPELTISFGEHSENILNMVKKLGPLRKRQVEDKNSDFSALLIVDRDKDYAAPLLTPAIYSALLLEVFPNNAGILELEMSNNKIQEQKLPIFVLPSKRDNEQQSNKSSKSIKIPTIHLNSLHDEIFAENRYKHFSAASSQIRQQAKSISMELQKLKNMKLDEMHDYVNRKLPKITTIKTKLLRHLNASEKVIQMLGSNFKRVQALEENILNNVSRKKVLQDIDELLTTDGHKFNILRLLALLHVCAGITTKELTQFIRNYCNYFGLKYLTIFEHLALAGLLPPLLDDVATQNNKTTSKLLSSIPLNMPKFQQTEFQANANRLKLMVSTDGDDDVKSSTSGSLQNITLSSTNTSVCPSYVFNRLYIPLIAQLASFLLKSTSANDFISKIAMIDGFQINGQPLKKYNQNIKQPDCRELLIPLKKRNMLVYVVGGITYAEIAACKLVSKITDSEIFVASDCILTGADLIAEAF